MKIQEIIVVEGRNDTIKIQQAVNADTIETNGSDINHKRLEKIKHASEKRGVIIFTDPDYPGERIRQIIDQEIPDCKHAFLKREKAKDPRSKTKNIGIEHASKTDIRDALKKVYKRKKTFTSQLKRKDLLTNGLIGGKDSREKRKLLGDLLHIGHPNGKQLLKRLQMFEISREEFERALDLMRKEEKGSEK